MPIARSGARLARKTTGQRCQGSSEEPEKILAHRCGSRYARAESALIDVEPTWATCLPDDLRARIDEADRRRCCYCLTPEVNSGIRLTFDHILPVSKGGATSFENICLACSACNELEAGATEATIIAIAV